MNNSEYIERRDSQGNLHHLVLPAIDFPGRKEWWLYGQKHRIDKPAVVVDGDKEEWCIKGKLHRDGGPAVTEWFEDGSYLKMWFQNGLLHNDCEPAVLYSSGKQSWYWEGKLHRDDGYPAVIKTPNDVEYWVYGIKVEKDSWELKEAIKNARVGNLKE